MSRPKPSLGFFLLMSIIVVLLVLLWSVKRRPDTKYRVVHPGSAQQLAESIAGVTHGNVEPGNSVVILQNGQYFASLFRDIEAARSTVHFETFLWHEGAIGQQLADRLSAAARRGVEVRLMLDASGARPMPNELQEMMRSAGVRVESFHAISLADLGRINNRTHRKLTIVDGRIGYVGGHCIADEWTGNARNRNEYRDTSVRVEGPIVAAMQSAFAENWIEETGEVMVGVKYYPPQKLPAGTSRASLAYVTPQGNASSVELLYYLAVISARKRLIVQNPYFLPDPEMSVALGQAVKRGVDVSVMLPSVEVTDSAIVQHASHHRFGDLLARGVKIFEYGGSLLHQKVIIVDDQWVCVGSTNFDDRSFELNDEISMVIIDSAVASSLEAAYAADLRLSKRRQLPEWQERGAWHKLVDGLAYILNEQL